MLGTKLVDRGLNRRGVFGSEINRGIVFVGDLMVFERIKGSVPTAQ